MHSKKKLRVAVVNFAQAGWTSRLDKKVGQEVAQVGGVPRDSSLWAWEMRWVV